MFEAMASDLDEAKSIPYHLRSGDVEGNVNKYVNEREGNHQLGSSA